MRSVSTGPAPADQFIDASRSLFGNIRQEFFPGAGARFCDLTYQTLGPCRLSKITASPHGVRAQKAAHRDSTEDSVKILVEMQGRSTFCQAGSQLDMKQLSAVIYDPTQPYAIDNLTNVDQVILQIPRSGLTDRALRRLARPLFLPGGADDPASTLASFILTSARTAAGLSQQMKASLATSLTCLTEGLVCDGLARGPDEVLNQTSLFLLRARIKDHVRRHLGDAGLGPQAVARAMGCSVRYLHKAFEGEGDTLQRHIWQARLQESQRMLAAPALRDRTIVEIAFACGFNSSAHFSRLYRERFAMTPREARFAGQA
jgi:AraC-like DNA-binding protein